MSCLGRRTQHQTIEKGMEMVQTMEEGKPQPKKELPKREMSFFELLRILRPYFWPAEGSDGAFINRIRSTSTWIMVIASKVCSLAAPFFLAYATNDLINENWHAALKYIVAFCLLKLASSVFRELQSIVYIKVKQQASIELQELTFKHLHALSLHWHLSKKTGSVIKSMDRGTEAANQLVTYLFLYLVPALAECLAVVILFFVQYKQWWLGIIVFCGVFMYSVTTIVITQWRKKFREATNKHDNEFHEKATDSIINFETVKYFTAEAFELERFKVSVVKYQHFNSSTQLSLSFLNISQQTILYGTLLGAMILSGIAVIHGNMSIGGWVAVQSWVNTIFVPLNFLGSVYAMIVQSLVDIKNLSELLFESPDIVDAPNAKPITASIDDSKGLSITFDNVSFHYPEQPVEKGLKGVSFTVESGTTVALVGHTGSGKTTISRLLFRFYDPLSGAVKINNQDIRTHTQKSVRDLIGIVPQDTVLFNDTILYNIQYGKRNCSFEEVVAAAESAQIRKFIESLPEKWNTVVGERGLKLSGGEKQRVAIARCLLKNPPIVVLDEATSALDTVTEYSIQEAINILGKNRTVIVIAHRLSTVCNSDKIIVLDGGSVLESGNHNQLLATNGQYAKLWNMQLRQPTVENTEDSANAAETAANQV